MRRSSKLNHNKKVSVLNEDEAERVRRIEGKKEIIRAEFEKHKKELAINVSEASKMNEIRLRSQLEELLNINAKKMKDLERMNNVEQDLERFNFESTQFFDTVSRFEVSKHSDAFLAVGSHPNRTTTMINDLKGDNAAEKLGEKMAQLMEMLSNVELLLEEEEEVYGNVYEKYEETKKDQLLLSKKVNELTKIYDHAGKRFTDLQRIEFLAQNKHAAATSDLKELKDELKELKDKEYAYKKQKEEEKRRETEFLHAKQNEMSHILIDIDKKRQEYLHSEEEIKRLDMKFEEMRDKRKNNRIVTKYIETLNALAQKSVNLLDAHQALKDLSKTLDASSPYKAPAGSRSGSAFNFNMDGSPSPPRSDPPESRHQKRGSVLDRNFYIDKIQRLYEQHPEGPQRLADALISEYNVQCRHEESLKSNYEELQQNKRRQEFELQSLEEELQQLKGKNEYITLGKSGSKILDSNEQEAIDSGMMIVDAVPTTLNQAKFDFENKKDADGNATLFTNTEAFVMRCYMDSIEMVSRFSKLLNSIYNQSGGHVSEDMKEIVKLAHAQINTLRRAKKMKPELSTSQFISEPYTEFHRTITDNSSVSERDKEPQEPIVTLDINDVYSLFLSVFDMEEEKGTEFIENIKSDVMIITFISLDDIKNYLQTCQSDHSIELNVQRALANTHHLRKVATENMMQRFETIYKLYTDTVTGTRQGTRDLLGYLMARGVDIPKEDVMAREDETNPFIKKAIHKKWQNLLDRYDYDPNRDYRKDNMESERSDHNVAEGHRERVEDVDDMNGEDWDREDTKAKLNEIVGALSKKQAFKGKNEEDQKRLQAKKDKERQKQALENMTDEDFLDWQRKQIKKDGRDDFSVTEVNEGELLRKAQADQALRLSSSAAPIEELKRMIENSRVLSKIQIRQ